MPTKKKLLILIPDGIGIKNYLLSDFIKLACNRFDVTLVHDFNPEIENEINTSSSTYKHFNTPKYKESLKHKFIRESLCYARLNYNSKVKSNPTIMVNWRRKFNQFNKKAFYRLVEAYGNYLSQNYNRIEKCTHKYHHSLQRSKSTQNYLTLFQNESPDIVFTTHQRALHNIPLFAAAKELNIKSVSAIYSWDNMPKARIPYFSDYFFVWSDYMKNEFDDYYPEIKKDKIKITGTPQFEFYLDESLIESKSTFFHKHGLDNNRPIICYSGDDKLTSPFDADYLRDVANSFSLIEVSKRPQIILRPSPMDDGKRFKIVLREFPDICYTPADWYTEESYESWTAKFPSKNDIKALVNLAYHSDAVVNLGSTMAHDFAIYGKPAFYLNYMPKPSPSSLLLPNAKNWSVETIYQYEHFKSMADLKPVYWINSEQDFNKIPDVLKSPSATIAKDQKIWRDRIIGKDSYKHASKTIVEELMNLT